MKKTLLKAATEQDFFRRGKALARLADKGDVLAEEQTISFDDPADFLHLQTASRLVLLCAAKSEPGSIPR